MKKFIYAFFGITDTKTHHRFDYYPNPRRYEAPYMLIFNFIQYLLAPAELITASLFVLKIGNFIDIGWATVWYPLFIKALICFVGQVINKIVGYVKDQYQDKMWREREQEELAKMEALDYDE